MNGTRLAMGGLVVALLLAGPSAPSQVMVRHAGGGDADVLVIPELGVVVGATEESGEIRVMMLLPDAPSDAGPARDDLLLMVDGKRVASMDALREAYESAAPGNTMKIGFRRGDRRFLSSFQKEAPEPGERRVVMVAGHGEAAGDMEPLPEFGAVLAERDGRVVVVTGIPIEDTALEEADEILTLNGAPIRSLEKFREAYAALNTGAELALVVARGGAEVSVTREKGEGSGMIRIRRGP